MKQKNCLVCGVLFKKSLNLSKANWENTKYCSHFCYARSLKGKHPNNYTHGMTDSRFYGIWCGMKKRCFNPNMKRYKDYGGRGIKVCKRWCSFMGFKDDMYPSYIHSAKTFAPTIERKDNDGNYEPKNCRWIPRADQAKNKHRIIN